MLVEVVRLTIKFYVEPFLVRTHWVEHISQQELCDTIIAREQQMRTAMGNAIAIPHGRIRKG